MSSATRERRRVTAVRLRDPVIGGGLILNRTSRGNLLLHTDAPGELRELGCFHGAADAWRAIDAIDRAAAH